MTAVYACVWTLSRHHVCACVVVESVAQLYNNNNNNNNNNNLFIKRKYLI